jgi:radical SAM superfamily enzyme YgiQ (UPF0313 family)
MPIETPRPDGSLGPLYLAGALEQAGYEVDILDASVGPENGRLEDTFYRSAMQPNGLVRIGMTIDAIREFIAKGEYNVVGINSNFTPQTKMAFEVAQVAKEISRDILVVAGGVNARNLPARFFRTGNFDAICATEGEKVITNLITAWSETGKFSHVSGLILDRDGVLVRNGVATEDVVKNLDELPVPRWEKLPFKLYDSITSPHAVLSMGKGRYAPIQTSRGCPFRCSYCHISVEKAEMGETGGIGALRLKSEDRVLMEIHRLRELGVKKLYFEDDSLLANKARVQHIFTRVQTLGMEIADVNGVNLVHLQKREGGKLVIDVEYLELLKNAGFDQIVFPVESASQRILNKYATGKLHHDTLDVFELVRIATKIGITCPVNIMIGFPDETEDEMRKSIEMGKRLVESGAAYVTFFIPIPFPGSQLYQMALDGGHLDPDFDTDILNWKNAVMRNTVVAPERVVEIRDEAWRYANTDEHVRARLEASIGTRWQSGAANG